MMQDPAQLDVLMVSERPLWPLDQGYRVHGSHMATNLAAMGLRVGVSTMHAARGLPPSLAELTLRWPEATAAQVARFVAGWSGRFARMRSRLAEHQGLDPAQLAGVLELVDRHRPAVVVALGPHGPMYLRGLPRDVARVWYAADDAVRFHLSCLRGDPRKEWRTRLRRLGVDAAIAALFGWRLDGVIGVTPADTAGLQRMTFARHAITIRNGVDLDHFTPRLQGHTHRVSPGVVFWGRLDFEPNIDAVLWFAHHVWPGLHWKEPTATFRIVGKHPSDAVRELARIAGIDVVGEVADIRPFAHDAAAVVLPMRIGGGIKNKLLEAAAMGRPIVASRRAVAGLQLPRHRDRWPAMIADRPDEWVRRIARLWSDPQHAARLGMHARAWAERHHEWFTAAEQLAAWLDSVCGRPLLEQRLILPEPTLALRRAA
jgi:glycosyltransferase involved in cell wall biosynthesis